MSFTLEDMSGFVWLAPSFESTQVLGPLVASIERGLANGLGRARGDGQSLGIMITAYEQAQLGDDNMTRFRAFLAERGLEVITPKESGWAVWPQDVGRFCASLPAA